MEEDLIWRYLITLLDQTVGTPTDGQNVLSFSHLALCKM